MSWRVVVVSSNAKVDYRLGYIEVRTAEKTQKVHIGEIAVLMLESTAVSVTAYAICELLSHKVKVIFCDNKRNPCGEIIPFYGSHDTSSNVRTQIKWSLKAKQSVWTEIVKAKIRGQREVLSYFDLPQADMLTEYLHNVTFNDATNREGHSAKVYFNALFGKEFSRNIDDPINAALNYGYGIMLSAVNREITSCGYITQLGIFHDNIYNFFNLGCDFMEPLRPIVDMEVSLISPKKFERSEKLALVSLLNKEVYIDGKQHFLNNAIGIYCKSLFNALENENTEEIRMIEYEF